MANSTANAGGTNASASPPTGTALRGRIEAIGVFDLLRIGVTNDSTGRLLVFNDQFDAELGYHQGRLVAVTSSVGGGGPALKAVLEMTEGEFEFTTGLEPSPEQQDAALHDAMMHAIKSHYQERVRARQDSSSGMPAIRNSGVHRVEGGSSVAVSPIVNIEQPTQAASRTVETDQVLPGEQGRAIADSAGRATAKLGTVSPQEAALSAMASKLAQNLAQILGMRDLQRFEICGANNRALLCRIARDGIHLSCITNQADAEAVWRVLEP